jgi:ABC-2 type transport system ATP-binding protein
MFGLRQHPAEPVAGPEPDPPAIRAVGVRKSYPGVEAVRGIDLTVDQGETFGFLGPNGAGKTTTIAMLCTLVSPTAGRIEIAGHDTRTAPGRVRRNLGLVFQETTLDGDLTAEENLRFHADLYSLPRATLSARVDAILDLVGLASRHDALVRTFSGGMRRRLEIARGLLHRPRVLFLDEPTIGLDPQARAWLWTHLGEVREREATTLFLTTHYLEEAERCDRIAIIDDGRIVAQGRPAELKSVLGADRVELRTGDAILDLVGLASRHDALVRTFSGGMRRRLEIARGRRTPGAPAVRRPGRARVRGDGHPAEPRRRVPPPHRPPHPRRRVLVTERGEGIDQHGALVMRPTKEVP